MKQAYAAPLVLGGALGIIAAFWGIGAVASGPVPVEAGASAILLLPPLVLLGSGIALQMAAAGEFEAIAAGQAP